MNTRSKQSLKPLEGGTGKDTHFNTQLNKDNLNEAIKTEVNNLTNIISKRLIPNEDILGELIKNIGPVDFQILAFPQMGKIKKEMNGLKSLVFDEKGNYTNDNGQETKRYNELKKELDKCKLTKTHYLVICIDRIRTLAKNHNWGLCKKNGFIYVFNGSFWVELDKEQFQYFLGNAALKMGVEKFKGKIYTFKEDLFKQFMGDAYLPTPKSNKSNVLINLQNGTFEITPTDQNLRAFKQEDFLTHQLPFEYDPEAPINLFQKYLDKVLPNREKQMVLAEYIGYVFTKTGVLNLEKILILFGNGANGKSVFFDIINALLGRENVSSYSLQELTENSGYYRAKVANKLVNYASEINGKMETDVFKQMASGEPISARLPYGEPFNIREYAKLIFNCNALPKDVEHTNAFFRRFLIIDFDVTIPENEQDKELSKKIIANELSGVFNWVLKGLDRLLKQKNFSKCDVIDNARANFAKQSDSVQLFIEDYNYSTSREPAFLNPIYETYVDYCMKEGYKRVSAKTFRDRIKKYHPYRTTIQNVNGWYAYLKIGGDD